MQTTSGESSKIHAGSPLVSIIIPFHNREEFLGDAIESVLAQTVEDWELLLIDDGSTDRSVEVVNAFAGKYPSKIRLMSHCNNENKGASASRNLGIGNAKGQYITFLDSDDIFFPNTLRKELDAFDKNPDADAVCGTLEVWYSWSEDADNWSKDFAIDLVLETEKLYQPPDLLVHNLNAGGRKPGIDCVMVKSEFAKRFELFEADYRYAWEDQVFWAKLSVSGQIYVMDTILARYRQHPASTCATESARGRDILSVNIFLDWLEEYLRTQGVENKEVWKALHRFQQNLYFETKLWPVKQFYRQMLPLHLRYKIRDKFTKLKRILSRSAHRHK